MSVSSTTNRVQYEGNDSIVTAYPIPFYFQDEAWINVQVVDADGVTTTLALGTDYAITGAGDPDGGDLTTVAAYDDTNSLTIYRVVPLTQLLDLVYNDRLPAEQIELALDKLTFIAQQLSTLAGNTGERALSFPVTEPDGNTSTLPAPAARLNKIIGFDAVTGELELRDGSNEEDAAASAVAAAASAVAAAASAVEAGSITFLDNAVTNAKLADVATSTVKARLTAGTGDPEDVTLPNFLTALAAIGAAEQSTEVTGSITAALGKVYYGTAAATYTDPTPVQGKGYVVVVAAVAAQTVGAVAYSDTGTIIYRIYNSAAWTSYVFAAVNTAATLSNKTLTNPLITNYSLSAVAIGNTGTAKTISLTLGTVQRATLTGNCTFTMPNVAASSGKEFRLELNTGAGSFTATFTSVKWAAGSAPTITTTASRLDILVFVSDGVNWYGRIFGQDYTP